MIFLEKLEQHLQTDEIKFEKKGNSSVRLPIDLTTPLIEGIRKIFHFEKIDEKKFIQVCDGTGGEIAKMDSIWSSSLLCFLFFYSAIKNGGIKIEIKEKNKTILFTDVYFEFISPTFYLNPNAYLQTGSNMDCVLVSNDGNDILFLESKFKEYVTDVSKTIKLSKKYNDKFTGKLYEEYQKFIVDGNKEKHYLYGLKQLITHYSGLLNIKRGIFYKGYEKGDNRNDLIKKLESNNYSNLYFTEILYDFSALKDQQANERLRLYKDDSTRLKDIMRKDNKGVFVLKETFTYQKLYKDNKDKIDASILEFYKFDR